MNIGIIGAGNIGTAIGKRLAAKGHSIFVSFARTPDKLAEAAAMIGGRPSIGTPDEAVRFGDVVLLATPWGVTLDTVRPLADALVGKVVWDATNPLKADMSGLEVGTTTSGGEEIARTAPGARVVKAVPPFADVLHSASTHIGAGRPGVFVCGDDGEARRMVMALVADLDAEATDAGPLSLARYTEPLGMLLVQLAYGQGFGSRIGVTLLQEPDHG